MIPKYFNYVNSGRSIASMPRERKMISQRRKTRCNIRNPIRNKRTNRMSKTICQESIWKLTRPLASNAIYQKDIRWITKSSATLELRESWLRFKNDQMIVGLSDYPIKERSKNPILITTSIDHTEPHIGTSHLVCWDEGVIQSNENFVLAGLAQNSLVKLSVVFRIFLVRTREWYQSRHLVIKSGVLTLRLQENIRSTSEVGSVHNNHWTNPNCHSRASQNG